MNVAIIIGNSNYNTTENNLPGCSNDTSAISAIINKTNKYEKILVIEDNTSALLKEKIITFAEELKGQKIEEFFFYYTGHGEYYGDEYYYLSVDFDDKKRQSTTLQNGFIDQLIKNTSPEVAVKIIDACQSGTSYIKSPDILKKYFDKTQTGFKKCYFLYSSLNTQLSYQDKNLSFFTGSFINALKNAQTDDVRYKHLLDYISDQFIINPEQTPFFVVQAEFTEKFCQLTKELKDYLVSLEGKKKQNNTGEKNEAPAKSIFDIVKEDSDRFTTKDGAMKSLEKVKEQFLEYQLDAEFNQFYDINKTVVLNHDDIPENDIIGRWLDENQNDYFAKPSRATFDDESIITGYLYTTEMPYCGFIVEILAKFNNITNYRQDVLLLISKSGIAFFYCLRDYTETGWDSKKLNDGIKWYYNIAAINDHEDQKKVIKKIFNNAAKYILTEIRNKYIPQPKDGGEKHESSSKDEKK